MNQKKHSARWRSVFVCGAEGENRSQIILFGKIFATPPRPFFLTRKNMAAAFDSLTEAKQFASSSAQKFALRTTRALPKI